MFDLPPATRALILANVGIFFLQGAFMGPALAYFALWPIDSQAAAAVGVPGFQLWQLLSYAFLHGNLPHLLINMWGLYMFGSEVERLYGLRRYLVYYAFSAVAAALAQLVVAAWSDTYYPTVGASGAVFGLLYAFARYFPNRRILLLFPPIPMPARVFVVVFAAIELFLGVTGTQAGVAHFAHLGGMAGGALLIAYWTQRLPIGRRR
jgi:membrane associated rhomboid family serine protease